MKRKTSRKKFNKKIKELDKELRDRIVICGLPFKDVVKWLNQVLVGYFHYYGITDNSVSLNCFVHQLKRRIFKNLNRRGSRRSYTWEAFHELMKSYPLAKPRVYVNIYGD